MKDYVKLCIRENNPDQVIIHVGTNKLDSERLVDTTAKSIILDVAKRTHKSKLQYISQYIRYSPTEWQVQ